VRAVLWLIILLMLQPAHSYANGLEIGDRADLQVYGELRNGTVFQPETILRNVQITYTGFVDGFTEAILGMREGEERVFTIPKERGYDKPHELGSGSNRILRIFSLVVTTWDLSMTSMTLCPT